MVSAVLIEHESSIISLLSFTKNDQVCLCVQVSAVEQPDESSFTMVMIAFHACVEPDAGMETM